MSMILQPNVEPISGYRLLRYLGRGGFGEVWEAEAPGGLRKAIKLAPMQNNEASLSCRELEGLRKIRSIRHPYLLSIERFEVVDGYLVIVMELADKSLADRYNECVRELQTGIPRDELLRYLKEAAEVLDLLNREHGLQHLDVKPENLFLCGGHIKVADFGLVQPSHTNVSQSAMAISPPYAAPELFDGNIEATADQYSLAVTYQELLTGFRPYMATDVRGLICEHLRGRPDLSTLPPSDRPIVGKALSHDANERYDSCLDLVESLFRAAVFGTPDAQLPEIAEMPTSPFMSRTTTKIAERPKNAAKPHFIPRPMGGKVLREPAKTAPIGRPQPKPESLTQLIGPRLKSQEFRATFLAFLPLEIFAHKLRGFIDALDAEVVHCDEAKTVLRFCGKGWLGWRSRGLFLAIETYSKNPETGFRIVETVIWSTNRADDHAALGRRATMLVNCLKAYLIAADQTNIWNSQSEAVVRTAIFG